MRDGNQVTFEFDVDRTKDLSGLRVNIHLWGKSTGSEWYGYSKIITVIDDGKVLKHRFKESYEPNYIVEAIDTKRGHHYFFENTINDGLRTDYTESYIFSDQKVIAFTIQKRNQYEDGGTFREEYNYKQLTQDTKPLSFYDPKNTEYKISTVYSQEDLKVFDVFSFEDLKTTSKLKEEDILRLNLTDEQKQELIKIHSQKEFIDP